VLKLVILYDITNFIMENLKSIQIDWRLTKEEISEVKEISKQEEKIQVLLETNKDFGNFIDSEYRSANESYLQQNGKSVNELQVHLWFKWDEVDGVFWKDTFFALIKYQRKNWLMVDWLAWPETNLSLFWAENIVKTKVKKHYESSSRKKRPRDIDNVIKSSWMDKISFTDILNFIDSWFKTFDYSYNSNDNSSSYNSNDNNSLTRMFYSEPLEKKWGMTYCSRTARKNLYNLWISPNDVKQWPSAIASMNMYNEVNYANSLYNLPEWTNVLDLFVDTSSKYEHRAAAYKNWWEWFVLDPYAKRISGRRNNRSPIPLDQYVEKYKIMWAFPKESKLV